MGKLVENIKRTKTQLNEASLDETPAIVRHKDGMYYLASVENGFVREFHPQTKSKDARDICKMNWERMYAQIQESTVNEAMATTDFEVVSDPRVMCKV